MSGQPKTEPIALGSVDDLVAYARAGEKPREAFRVGTEHEKIGLRSADLRPVPYEGEQGIEGVLGAVAEQDGWAPIYENDALIALEKDGASITLEPGGQLELSGAPLATIFETCAEFHRHLDLIRRVSEPRGIVWLSLGANPLHDVAEIPRVPKQRYGIMRSYLPVKGELALDMMHLTATVQANLDYATEEDMVAKMRTAMGVSPIVSAMFANSALHLGKPSGFVSRRVHIWRHVDPDRCGMLPFVFDPDFGYARYVEWALDVPVFFVLRDGHYLPTGGAPFRALLESGFEGSPVTLLDWDLHLTTLFPEVRLKQFLEVRGADAVPPGLICALPALWKGLLYDPDAQEAAWRLVSAWSAAEREAALDAVARRGLAAEVVGGPVLDLAHELVAIARAGLARIGDGSGEDPDETRFLAPLQEVLERGRSPGEEVLLRWENEWDRSPARLIDYARY
ncbi:MAG: glutamate--cysteine ligase [Myxococcota bacterium]